MGWARLPRSERAVLAIALIVMTGLMLGLRHRAVTGDEARYVLFSASLWLDGHLVMPLADWQRVSADWLGYRMEELPALGGGAVLGHPVYTAALLSPLAAFGLSGLRVAGLAAGIGGLFLLYRAARTFAAPAPCIAAIVAAGLSFPLLPYLYTYWMEVFIFLGVSAGLLQLAHAGESARSDLWRGALVLAIPFVHLRASVVGAALFLAFLLRVYQRSGSALRRVAPVAALAGLFALVLVGLNLWIYGTLSGSVNTARPPSLADLFDVAATNLVSIKGALPYAPLWILGYAGLLAGALRGQRLMAECLLLTVVAVATSIGVNPGEGWPGRFIVASCPMLALGFAFWLTHARQGLQTALTAVLVALTLVHSLVFFKDPNIHIENRASDRVFETIFDSIGTFHPGILLPVEGIDTGLARLLLLAVFVLVVLAALSVRLKSRWPAMAALLLALCLIDLSRVREIEAVVRPIADGVLISLPTQPRQVLIAYGKGWESWYVAPDFPVVTAGFNGGERAAGERTAPANQVVSKTCFKGIDTVTLRSDVLDVTAAAAFRLRAFEPRSILLRWGGRFLQSCP